MQRVNCTYILLSPNPVSVESVLFLVSTVPVFLRLLGTDGYLLSTSKPLFPRLNKVTYLHEHIFVFFHALTESFLTEITFSSQGRINNYSR